MTVTENTAPRVVVLSGGVGGARLARGFNQVLPPERLTVVVNVGDDEEMYGVHVSPDIDTVLYTLAGVEGPHGWGLADDTYDEMELLGKARVDTRFRMGDRDIANSRRRKDALRNGIALSTFTGEQAAELGVAAGVLPATDDRLRTRVETPAGWLDFQEYFVLRRHEDEVVGLDFDGAANAKPAPGVEEALADADLVVIAPSNPPLSIWPILAVPAIREAVAAARRVVAVSPLFGGHPVKGPADRVMASLGLPPGNAGVIAAYDGLVTDLVVDARDSADTALATDDLAVHAFNTLIVVPAAAAWLAERLVGL